MEEITKIYPNGFIANRNVTFSVNENEIHALVGENGAGKTTLMKILFGMENCQTGKIYIDTSALIDFHPQNYKRSCRDEDRRCIKHTEIKTEAHAFRL